MKRDTSACNGFPVRLHFHSDPAVQDGAAPGFAIITPFPVLVAGQKQFLSVFADHERFLSKTTGRGIPAIGIDSEQNLILPLVQITENIRSQNAMRT